MVDYIMPTQTQLLTQYIPFEESLYVARIRRFIGDNAALNVLHGEEESDNFFIYECLQDALDEINTEFLPATTWTIQTCPSWNALKIGTVLQILTGKGILSARNTLTYQDSGGVTVHDLDTYGRYINYYNVLINKYMRSVQSIKISYNVDQAYGGVASEYGIESAW